jgi:hypothetical protein
MMHIPRHPWSKYHSRQILIQKARFSEILAMTSTSFPNMFQTRSSILRAALMTATVTVLPSPAADLYWDTNGATAGSGSASAAWDTGFNWSPPVRCRK